MRSNNVGIKLRKKHPQHNRFALTNESKPFAISAFSGRMVEVYFLQLKGTNQAGNVKKSQKVLSNNQLLIMPSLISIATATVSTCILL